MPELDSVAPNYRRAQRRWPDAPTLTKCHEALRACFDTNANGQVEHVKSFIESVCLTIMGELREPMPSATPSTTDLLTAALRPLGFQSRRGASKLDKVLSGFNRLASALTEMRDENGPLAHGKDAFLDPLTADHARAFLHVGDALLGVLLNALEGKQPDLTVTREPYESFPHLNERIDRAVSVKARIDGDGERPMVVFSIATGPQDEAIELRVEPSRLLYGIDRSAYIEVLRTADLVVAEAEEPDDEEVESTASGAEGPTHADVLRSEGPSKELLTTYAGPLEPLRPGLEAFLRAEGIDASEAVVEGAQLMDSLLATAEQNMGLDWKGRESLQARLKVSCKRVFVQFGLLSERADRLAGRLVAWLQVQAPEVETGIPMTTTEGNAA